MDSKECYDIWGTMWCPIVHSIMDHENHTHLFMGIIYGTIGTTNANNKEVSYRMV